MGSDGRPEDADFFAHMAEELEATARKLEARETVLVAQLGADRVEELAALWAKTLDPADEDELKRTMDWSDKELIWVWARLERARARRVLVGRQAMMNSQYGTGSDGGNNDGGDGTDVKQK